MKRAIPFTKYKLPMFLLSFILLATGLIITIANKGFNLGVDFEAGLNLQVQVTSETELGIADMREIMAGFEGVQVQVLGIDELQRFSIRLRDRGEVSDFVNVKRNEVTAVLASALGEGNAEILSEDYVEPRFASNLVLNTTILVIAAMACILIYLWVRFRFAYALSSLVTLVHDIAFIVFFTGAFQIEITSATVAAVLTIIGYSLNDTIVIFDRIRENEKLLSDSTFSKVIDVSITQSLSRTIITSLTTLLAVSAIFIFTTGTIQNFALNMIVGIIVGTYSSIFIASSFLLALTNKANRKNIRGVQDGEKPKRKISDAADDKSSQNNTTTTVDSSVIREQIRAQRQRKRKR